MRYVKNLLPYPASITHSDNILAFILWLTCQLEPFRKRILEKIYPDILDPMASILLSSDRLPSFSWAIIKYVSEAKGITVSVGDRRVHLAAETVEVVTCMAVCEDPDISADELLYLIQRAVHDYAETDLNISEKYFEETYEWIASELREYMHPK